MLDRLPAAAATGVGSLPFGDADEAMAHVASAYDVPFCPQLPRVEGDMVTEWLGSDPCRCGWSPERDRERPQAWDSFLASLTLAPPAHGVVKLQVTGPLTLAVALEARGRDLVDRAAAIELAAEVSRWLAATVAEQVRAVSALGLDALVVCDEPTLELLALDPGAAARAWDALRAVSPAWGLHVCCRVPWDVVAHAEPDVLSFDLAGSGPLDRHAAGALAGLVRGGARIAWGVARVGSSDGPAEAARWMHEAATALAPRGIDREQLVQRSLLTPSCGTALATPERERALAAGLTAAAGAVRAWASSGSRTVV